MHVLRRGHRGVAVRRWQAFLLGQGFDPRGVDGVFGAATEAATAAFQRRFGLPETGALDNRTAGQAQLLGFEVVRDRDDDRSGPNWPPIPVFKPIVGTAGRQREFGRFAFVHEPVPGNPENIRIIGDWERANIVTAHLPQLAGVRDAPRSGEVRFHRAAVAQLEALWRAWEDAGLTDRVRRWSGSFVPRFIRGSRTTLSNHAFGTAFDINFDWNQLGRLPALLGEEGCVRELVPLAHAHGFYWGGHFRNRPDGMHFEVATVMPG